MSYSNVSFVSLFSIVGPIMRRSVTHFLGAHRNQRSTAQYVLQRSRSRGSSEFRWQRSIDSRAAMRFS